MRRAQIKICMRNVIHVTCHHVKQEHATQPPTYVHSSIHPRPIWLLHDGKIRIETIQRHY